MKVVILAGGMGTRISEESYMKPKPMITIGGHPVLWHIMKIYASQGFREFVICCGYKGHLIKNYFLDYYMHQSDITVNLRQGRTEILKRQTEDWKVTLVNTGLHTMTAGRIMQAREYLNEEPFMLTYGDGVGNIDLKRLLQFHRKHKKTATVTVAKPEGRFGALHVEEDNTIYSFREKKKEDQSYVNAGFAVFNPDIFEYLTDGSQMLEQKPYENLASNGQMKAYCHDGFWAPMDNIRDRRHLEELWAGGHAPWKIWQIV